MTTLRLPRPRNFFYVLRWLPTQQIVDFASHQNDGASKFSADLMTISLWYKLHAKARVKEYVVSIEEYFFWYVFALGMPE